MSSLREKFFVCGSTIEGERELDQNEALQAAMGKYIECEEAHKVRVPDSCLLGFGKYSFTYSLQDKLAIKISGPTTSKEAREMGTQTPPEDLVEQFYVLGALRRYLGGDGDITTPSQFFVSYTPRGSFILVQELMRGWTSLENRTNQIYGTGPESPEATKELNHFTDGWRNRLRERLGTFALRRSLNDLGGRTGRLHGGNLLVPETVALDENTPLCVIDQPCRMA